MLEQEKNWLLIAWNLRTKHRWPKTEPDNFLQRSVESNGLNEEPKYVNETLRKHQEIYDNNYMHTVPNRAGS